MLRLRSKLMPFSRNQIESDPKGLPLNVELKSTSQHTAPTAGAVVRVKYETENKRRAALIRARTADGKPLPFGTEVFDGEGQKVGTVAQAGRIVVHGLKAETGKLKVSLGSKPEDACTLDYALPKAGKDASSAFTIVDSECVR